MTVEEGDGPPGRLSTCKSDSPPKGSPLDIGPVLGEPHLGDQSNMVHTPRELLRGGQRISPSYVLPTPGKHLAGHWTRRWDSSTRGNKVRSVTVSPGSRRILRERERIKIIENREGGKGRVTEREDDTNKLTKDAIDPLFIIFLIIKLMKRYKRQGERNMFTSVTTNN